MEDAIEWDRVRNHINVAAKSESIKEETSEKWAYYVSMPVISCAMAPREARAILEIAGYFKNRGVSVEKIVETMNELHKLGAPK